MYYQYLIWGVDNESGEQYIIDYSLLYKGHDKCEKDARKYCEEAENDTLQYEVKELWFVDEDEDN